MNEQVSDKCSMCGVLGGRHAQGCIEAGPLPGVFLPRPMTEQLDPLADLATRLRGLSLGNGSETLWATITEAADAIDRLAAVVRASGAGLGGITLARVREEGQLRADVWRDRYARAEAETEAIAGDLAALREGVQRLADEWEADPGATPTIDGLRALLDGKP